jgi:hypothetical protein
MIEVEWAWPIARSESATSSANPPGRVSRPFAPYALGVLPAASDRSSAASRVRVESVEEKEEAPSAGVTNAEGLSGLHRRMPPNVDIGAAAARLDERGECLWHRVNALLDVQQRTRPATYVEVASLPDIDGRTTLHPPRHANARNEIQHYTFASTNVDWPRRGRRICGC